MGMLEPQRTAKAFEVKNDLAEMALGEINPNAPEITFDLLPVTHKGEGLSVYVSYPAATLSLVCTGSSPV